MSIAETIKGLIFKKPSNSDQRRNSKPLDGGRRQGENENPYSLMATSNSPTFGQSNSPRQDG